MTQGSARWSTRGLWYALIMCSYHEDEDTGLYDQYTTLNIIGLLALRWAIKSKSEGGFGSGSFGFSLGLGEWQ